MGVTFRRAIAPMALLAASGAVLAGCGSSQGASSNQASGTSQGPLKIIMWVNPPAVTAVKKIDKEFEKKYGVKVQLQTEANDTSGYVSLQQTAVQGGTADIMGIQPFDPLPYKRNSNTLSNTQEWAINNVFVPLNNQPWVSKFKTADLNAASYGGKYYGLVTGVYQTGIFYNKAIFAKYHLQVPTTYNQFISVCQTLKSHGVTPVWTGLAGGATGYLMFMMYPIMEDQLAPTLGNMPVSTALASGKVKWTNPKMITTFKREQVFASRYLEPNYAGENWQQMPGAFAAGKAAMLLDGSWDLASVMQANPSMQVGYFPFPGSNNAANNEPVANPDLTWTILNNSKNKALAEKWLNFFASKPIYSQYVKITGISPSENGRFTSQTSKAMNKWFGAGRIIEQSTNFLLANGPFDLQPTNFWAAQLKMLQGGTSPAALAQTYETAQQQALK